MHEVFFSREVWHTRGMTKASKKAPAKAKAAPAPVAAPAANDKIGKTQLVELIADRAGLNRKQAGEAVDATLKVILEALQAGKAVGLPGVGTFQVRETAARTGVRPGTTERIQLAAGKKVAFKVASTLKASL